MPYTRVEHSQLYRWISEPALWARLVLDDLDRANRAQARLGQLHALLHDALDASGFILWRSFPALRSGMAVTLKQLGREPNRIELARVSIKQADMHHALSSTQQA